MQNLCTCTIAGPQDPAHEKAVALHIHAKSHAQWHVCKVASCSSPIAVSICVDLSINVSKQGPARYSGAWKQFQQFWRLSIYDDKNQTALVYPKHKTPVSWIERSSAGTDTVEHF
jgi:hypothetical protein